MAVNKIFPRTLSKSKDARFRKKTEMVDALNVRLLRLLTPLFLLEILKTPLTILGMAG